jgi:hypothetical protein
MPLFDADICTLPMPPALIYFFTFAFSPCRHIFLPSMPLRRRRFRRFFFTLIIAASLTLVTFTPVFSLSFHATPRYGRHYYFFAIIVRRDVYADYFATPFSPFFFFLSTRFAISPFRFC